MWSVGCAGLRDIKDEHIRLLCEAYSDASNQVASNPTKATHGYAASDLYSKWLRRIRSVFKMVTLCLICIQNGYVVFDPYDMAKLTRMRRTRSPPTPLLHGRKHMSTLRSIHLILDCQPTGPNPLNDRDDFSRPALCHGSLNSLFQEALYLPSYEQVKYRDFIQDIERCIETPQFGTAFLTLLLLH